MTPDFTLIWPLSCLKDGVHLSQALRIGCQDDFMGARNDMKPVTAPSVKFTYGDFLNFPNDGKPHEMPF